MNVWQVFETAATRFADRTAVELQRRDSLERRTYRELHQLALDRASWLSSQGIGPGDRCAILADNDGWWCGAYLGVLRLGAVAVPLDTTYSAAQIATILRDSGTRVLFVDARLMPTAREALANLPDIVLADVADHVNQETCSADLQVRDVTRDDPAVILYTSGTTADPKGVVLTHGNLIAERDATFAIVPVSEQDSVLGVLPLFHALAQLANLILPFAVGARVVFLETLSSSELLRALAEREITIFACVPQFFYLIHERVMKEVHRVGLLKRVLFQRLLATSFALRRAGLNVGPVVFARIHRLLGPHMRLFITAGSKVDPSIGRDFYALGFTILQAYGLTETTGAATLTTPDDAYWDTVGRALPGQEIKILPATDTDLDGEIAIRGPVVMQGYFNRPDVTRAVMQDGWFLSGDLGRLDAGGRLTITGRKKEIIVLASGKNIYPEEIEHQYRESPVIKEICVLGLTREDEPSAERLFAVVVPDADVLREKRIVNAGDLLRFEMEGQSIHLPLHKRVLGYEVSFAALPRTTTGKIKRHEVERGVRARQKQASMDHQPGAVADKTWADDPHAVGAAAIVRTRARGAVVRATAHLELDLGLDSMERVELLTELEQRFGVRVPPDRAHEILTVAQLIEAVRPGEGHEWPVSAESGAGSGARRPDGKAQGASIVGLFERRATQPGGMPRPETAPDSAETGHEAPERSEHAWAILLRDLPAESDPNLRGLLERRPIAAPLFFALSRVMRLLARTVVTGEERLPSDGPYIISPNHQGYLDPFLVCGVLPYRVFRNLFFVGAAEYFETPSMRWLARQLNLLPVDPDANLVSAMKACAFGLRHGKILVLFPEGERSIDGTVKRFKKGAPILAHHLRVPIVPVALRGAFELWPRNRSFNWHVLLPWRRHRVRVAFSPPMRFDRAPDYAESAGRLRDTVEELWNAL